MSGSVDRTRRPEAAPIRAFDFPDVESAELGNGLRIRSARMPRLPLVSAHLLMPGGETVLDQDRAGLAALTGDALEGGTQLRSGSELAEALEGIGADLHVGTGWDATTVSLSCLADRLEEAMGLLAEVVRRPSFPEEEVDRARNQRLARLHQRAMDPPSRATDQALGIVYPEGHPYGRPLVGTQGSLEAASRDAVRGLAEAYHRPAGAGLVMVGDLEAEDVERLAVAHFGDWSGAAPSRRSLPANPESAARRVHVVHRAGSVQSELRVGHPGVARDTPDYFALVVGTMVLGGSFTSRLNLNLRERHGFTYGVRARFAFRRGPGPFMVSTAVGTDVTSDAVREMVAEIERWAAAGPTEDETAAARDYIAGVFPLRLETTGQVASRIAELVLFDLPDDWHALYRDRVRAVDHGLAAEAARRHVRPEELQIVAVGDADEIVEPLRALDIGPVEVHDPA